MFLVGDFSKSKYLQKRIKEEFQYRVKKISIPINPIVAIQCGAIMYGLNERDNTTMSTRTRILNFTYGIEVVNHWVSYFNI